MKMELHCSRIKWAILLTITTLVVLSIGCSAASLKLSKKEQADAISVCKQFLEALRQDRKPTVVSLLDKRSNCLQHIKKIDDAYPVIEQVRAKLRLAGKTTPITNKSLVLSTKCPQNIINECIDRAFFWNDTKGKQACTPVLVEYSYRDDQLPALILMVKMDGKWRMADLPEWNTKIYNLKSIYKIILANRTILMSYTLDSVLVETTKSNILPNTTLPKQEQAKIIAVCIKYLEALRLGKKAVLVTLVAPATEYHQQIQTDTVHLDENLSSSVFTNEILPGNGDFPNIDTCRARLGLNVQKTPVNSQSLTISKKCPWTVMKDIVDISYVGQKAPSKLNSPSTMAMVEYSYLKNHLPVVIPMVKIDNNWLVACVPAYNTKIYKLKRFYDLADLYKADQNQFLSYTFDCVDSEPTRYAYPTQEQREITSTCKQYIEALRLGQKQQLLSLTYGDTINGRIIRSEGKRYDSYISSWVQKLGLKQITSPAEDGALAISAKCPWSLMKDIIVFSYSGSDPKRLISLSTIALVEFGSRQDKPPVIIPVAKINGKWLVMGMPELDISVYKYKRINDYFTLAK